MIKGLGLDLVEIDRIRRILKRFGDRFGARVLTPAERAAHGADTARYLASRFAAKEAAVKALGTGFRDGIGFYDLETGADALGKPSLTLTGAALARARDMGVAAVHLSITHGRDTACAVVVLEG
ncbi:MAG: holo-[acyl-carrier-protein] synthase [Desulfovibrionaceae bacterium]|nr:holo-[acyl-carrier-protein] synthase [Desulfovibrionaceae bacterium]MBF0515266.1 holo-[acyl-carrier-protein] synthase [Desulfovibrionaceae bacterium]